jgi:quinol monooxygenase YgiN
MSIGLVVHLDIDPAHLEEFCEIVTKHGAYSVSHEPGCISFTVIRDDESENKIILVETYADDAALQSHWNSSHMQAYRDKTTHMIVNRERHKGEII